MKSGIEKTYPFYQSASREDCHRHIWKAEELEKLVWNEVEKVLSDPATVTEAVKNIEEESSDMTSHANQIETIKNKLTHLEREKDRIWAAFRIAGDEAQFTEEIKQNQTKIDELRRRKADLERWIELQKQAATNVDDIKKACEVVRTNLGELTIENKRFALEALNVKVWLDGDNVKMEGIIPITHCQVSFAKSPY